jgi:hypothetical protein
MDRKILLPQLTKIHKLQTVTVVSVLFAVLDFDSDSIVD